MSNYKVATVLLIFLVALFNPIFAIIGYAKPQTQVAYVDKFEAFVRTQM